MFKEMDRRRTGFLTMNEFRWFLREYGITTTGKDLLALMSRYDRNNDGKVTIAEFHDEVAPHSPVKIY